MCIKKIRTLYLHCQLYHNVLIRHVNTTSLTTAWMLQYPQRGTPLAMCASIGNILELVTDRIVAALVRQHIKGITNTFKGVSTSIRTVADTSQA